MHPAPPPPPKPSYASAANAGRSERFDPALQYNHRRGWLCQYRYSQYGYSSLSPEPTSTSPLMSPLMPCAARPELESCWLLPLGPAFLSSRGHIRLCIKGARTTVTCYCNALASSIYSFGSYSLFLQVGQIYSQRILIFLPLYQYPNRSDRQTTSFIEDST